MSKRISVFLFLLNIFFLVNSADYQSTEEAFLLRDHKLCLGNCFHHDGAMKCVYDWWDHEAECKVTKVKTKKYRTKSGKTCHSNCGKYGDTYDWCATNINNKLSWDECTTLQVTRAKATIQTEDLYLTCSDECAKRTSAKPWCNTVMGFKNCDPDNKVILFGRFTSYHVMCASPCSMFNNLPFCYDVDGVWIRCYLNQNKDTEISELSKYLESNWDHGEYTQKGYKLCKKAAKKELEHSFPANVESLARYYENEFSTVIVRPVDSKNIVTDNYDPTIQYTVFDTIYKFGEDQFVVPLVYRGIVTNHTLRRSEKKDPDWPARIKSNYDLMKPILDDKNQDRRGHLLAPGLGGPTERFNIFPQSISNIIGNFSRWYYLEADIFNFIDRHDGSYAEYVAVLSYDLTASTPYRPTAVGLSVRLYNKDNVLCDINGIFVSNRVNTLTNMFFTNDPKFSCKIE